MLALVAAAVAVVVVALAGYGEAVSPIRMQDIEVLSFYSDGYTGTMRGQSIPQMTLMTPDVPSYAVPEEIVCTNMGWDGLNVHWDCKADLKESWSMHNTVISCEGWSHPGDEYVVPGSCAISYELRHKPVEKKAEEKHRTVYEEPKKREYKYENKRYENKNTFQAPHKDSPKGFFERLDEIEGDITFLLFMHKLMEWGKDMLVTISAFTIVVVLILIILCCKCCAQDNKSEGSKSEKKSSKKDDKKEDPNEDVVEKHAHAISYSR